MSSYLFSYDRPPFLHDLFGRILFSLTLVFFKHLINLSFTLQPANLYFEVTPWKNTSKCLNFAPNRTVSVLLGADKFIAYLILFNLILERRKAMKTSSIVSLVLFALLKITFASVAIAQMAAKGWEKTVTLSSGEVLLDMSGEWDEVGGGY
jgi:hypothetical protein